MEIKLVNQFISRKEIVRLADDQFGDMVKAVVDINRKVMGVGGELHADAEALLLENGSAQTDVWGINLYPDRTTSDWIEFTSLINIRPSQGNRSTGVQDAEVQKKIIAVVNALLTN